MAGNVHDLIEYALIKLHRFNKKKAKIIAYHFGDVESFLVAGSEEFLNLKFQDGTNAVHLTTGDLTKIKELQASGQLDNDLPPGKNVSKLIAERFLGRQVENIREITLSSLNCNPILITSLRLNTPELLIRYYTYQSATRSIVTSGGFYVQELLLYAGENVQSGKGEDSTHGTKWDLVIDNLDDMRHWIEVKSGPNDLNRTQVLAYRKAIEEIENIGDRAYIGETYGKRAAKTITHNHYKTSLPNWDKRTLIGKELWTFVSENENYHLELMMLLRKVAESVLSDRTIIDVIDEKYGELLGIFNESYSSVNEFVDDLW